MKMNIKINNAPAGDQRATPPELKAGSQTAGKILADLLRLHGIKSITAKPTMVGTRSVLRKDYVPFLTDPPGHYVTIRDEVVSLLAQYISLLGITSIDLEPNDQEMKVIIDTWSQIEKQAAAINGAETAKAPPTTDPGTEPIAKP